MKATLSFNLPEDTEEFRLAQNGWQFRSVLDDLDRMLRNKLKHESLSDTELALCRQLREEIFALLSAYGVHL